MCFTQTASYKNQSENMLNPEVDKTIQKELSEGRLSEALDILLAATEQYADKNLKDDLLLLKSKFEYNRNQYEVKGILTDQEFNIHYSKTALGAQEILERLRKGVDPEQEDRQMPAAVPTNNYRPVFWLAGCLSLLLAGWFLWPDAPETITEAEQVTDSTTVNLPTQQDPDIGTGAEPVPEPAVTSSSPPTTAKPPPMSTDVAKKVDETAASTSQKVEEATVTPPARTFKVNITRNSNMSDADIYVDDKPAVILSNTLVITTIRVTEKPDMHVFELRKAGENLDCKKALLITQDNQRINFTCN